MTSASAVVGVVLAGGRSERMGGRDKRQALLGGRTLLDRAIARAARQVDWLVVSANDDPPLPDDFAGATVPDAVAGFQGPLCGILSALAWVGANRPEARWLATFACDTPFFPEDLVNRLRAGAERAAAQVAVAASGRRHHPVFSLWRTDIDADPVATIRDKGVRKVDDGIALFSNIRVEFEAPGADPFFNVNTADDLARAEALMRLG